MTSERVADCIAGLAATILLAFPTFDVDRAPLRALALSNPVKLLHFGK
jgi:hypothetical protein